MSFADVVLTQMFTLSDKDVDKIYYAMKAEAEKRWANAKKKSELTGLQKVEDFWPNIYQSCTKVVAQHLDEHNFCIDFTPKKEFLVTKHHGRNTELLPPPYSVRLSKLPSKTIDIFEATVDLNDADSCGGKYSDLWYGYKTNAEGMMVPKKAEVPSIVLNIPIVRDILSCPGSVWYALLTPLE